MTPGGTCASPMSHTQLDRAALRGEIAALFTRRAGVPRIGLEVEALAVDRVSRRPVPPSADRAGGASLVPVLESWARDRGWGAEPAAGSSPRFTGPRGQTISFEPGGQLEYASPPVTGLADLECDLLEVMSSVAGALAGEGIELVARGLDPTTPLSEARLRLDDERYRRMSEHFARRGPWGRRMMRQTAALHVNIGAPGRSFEAWAVANAAAPALLAAFANSPRIEGSPSGHRSARAAQWRRLDPSRTGISGGAGDPVETYLDFALGADAFLLGPEGESARPFEAHLDAATPEQWRRHLTTLFPEVRPRGYLEVRSLDALPLGLAVLPAALLVGLLFDARTRERAAAALGPADPDLLERAGRSGLGDREVAARADTVFELGLEGLRSLPAEVRGPDVVPRLEAFRASFTDEERDPGHRVDDRLIGEGAVG